MTTEEATKPTNPEKVKVTRDANHQWRIYGDNVDSIVRGLSFEEKSDALAVAKQHDYEVTE